MSVPKKRPASIEIPIRMPHGQVVNQAAAIHWLSPRIGYADVPTAVIGEKLRVLVAFDGSQGQITAPTEPSIRGLMDALLVALADIAEMRGAFHKRLQALEGFAVGERAESEANAPGGPTGVVRDDGRQ